MRNGELSTAAVRRLIEKAGAERVGDDAVEEMRRILEEYAVRVSKEATTLATHAGRKTVKAEDIQLVIKRIQQLEPLESARSTDCRLRGSSHARRDRAASVSQRISCDGPGAI